MASYDTSTINLSTIKQLKTSFDQEASKYKSLTHSTFSSSYLKTCSDSNVRRMANKLDTLYKNIDHGYDSICKWWESYNENVQGLEKFLSSDSHSGSITEQSVRNFANSKLFDLDNFKIDYAGTFSKNVVNNTTMFINNRAASYFVDNSRGIVSGLSSFGAISNVAGVAAVTAQNNYDLSEITETIGAYASSAKSKVEDWFSDAGDEISNALSNVGSWFSGAGKAIKNKTEEVVSDVQDGLSEVGAVISDGAKSVWNETKEFFTHDLPIIGEMVVDSIWDGLQKTGATIAVALQSLVQGILLFGEALYDVITLAGGAIGTIVTGIMDLGALISGDDAHYTKDMWGMIKAEVSKQYVNGWFADINASAYGQWLNEYSYIKTDSMVAKVLTGVGYITGVIALTVATCGVGGVAMSGTAATVSVGSTSATITYGSIVGGSISGLTGIGKNTEVAWNDGAGILEGLGYGAAMGAWEGVQYFIGGNINGMKLFNGTGALSNVGNTMARVALDGIGGAAEGFVTPATQMIYKDGESFNTLFEENGGWGFVATNATIGSAFSFVSELGDLASSKITNAINAKSQNINSAVEGSPTLEKTKINILDFFNKKKNKSIDLTDVTERQMRTVNYVNQALGKGEEVTLTFKNTTEISTAMLSKFDDLDKVTISVVDGLGDANGKLKFKYQSSKYIDRVTYSGNEMYHIIGKIEDLQSKIDINLPELERARNVYDVLSTEVPVMRDYTSYADGHKVSASLRGLTKYNSVGKEGLVCAGYASVYKELCDRIGVKCEYIRGLGVEDLITGKKGGHAWNVVKVEDEIYPVDVTWKACGEDGWFGASDNFAAKHIADADEMYRDFSPSVNAAKEVNLSSTKNVVDSVDDNVKLGKNEVFKLEIGDKDFEFNDFSAARMTKKELELLKSNQIDNQTRYQILEKLNVSYSNYVKAMIGDNSFKGQGQEIYGSYSLANFLAKQGDYDKAVSLLDKSMIKMKALLDENIDDNIKLSKNEIFALKIGDEEFKFDDFSAARMSKRELNLLKYNEIDNQTRYQILEKLNVSYGNYVRTMIGDNPFKGRGEEIYGSYSLANFLAKQGDYDKAVSLLDKSMIKMKALFDENIDKNLDGVEEVNHNISFKQDVESKPIDPEPLKPFNDKIEVSKKIPKEELLGNKEVYKLKIGDEEIEFTNFSASNVSKQEFELLSGNEIDNQTRYEILKRLDTGYANYTLLMLGDEAFIGRGMEMNQSAHLADIFARQGDYDKAVVYLNRSLSKMKTFFYEGLDKSTRIINNMTENSSINNIPEYVEEAALPKMKNDITPETPVAEFVLDSNKLTGGSKMLLSIDNFKKLSVDEQMLHLENCPINNIVPLLEGKEITDQFQDVISKRILNNQDYIIISKVNDSMNSDIDKISKYAFNNEQIVKELSDDNLIRGLSETSKGTTSFDMLIAEIERRIDDGKMMFDRSSNIKSIFGMEMNDSLNAFTSLSNDYQQKVIELLKKKWQVLPQNIKDLDLDYEKFFQQGLFARMYESGHIDDNALRIIMEINETNPKAMKSFNFELLNKEIVDALDENYIKEIANYSDINVKIVSLYKNNKKLFDSFAEVIKKSKADDSLTTFYAKTKCYLDFLFENSNQLDGIESSQLVDDSFVNYVINNKFRYKPYSSSKKISIDYNLNYDKNIAIECDNLFDSAFENFKGSEFKFVRNKALIDMKNAYFQKYFSILYEDAQVFLSKYGDHIDEVLKYDDNLGASTILKIFKTIDGSNDIDYLKNLYDNEKLSLSAEEMLHMDAKIKQTYAKSYIDTLSDTSSKIKNTIYDNGTNLEKVMYNGKEVNIVSVKDDFSFLVYSSDTGFVVDEKQLINDSYKDTWKALSDPKTHGLSTSYITSKNIGSAPVQGKGVLYGFTDINADDIAIMAPYDVNGHIADYGFSSGNQQIYISAEKMPENTLRVYNEFVLNRPKVKPSCIIIYDDATDKAINSAIKAAAEWEIPVVKISKVDLAQKQIAEVDSLINSFNETRDVKTLKEAIDLYESNVSGYKLNANLKDGEVDATASINNDIVADMFNSSKIDNVVIKYIDELKNMDNNKQAVSELIGVLEAIKAKYDLVNVNGTKIVSNTKASFEIDTLIGIAKEIMKGE